MQLSVVEMMLCNYISQLLCKLRNVMCTTSLCAQCSGVCTMQCCVHNTCVVCTTQWCVHNAMLCAQCTDVCTMPWFEHNTVLCARCRAVCTMQWCTHSAVMCAQCRAVCTMHWCMHCVVSLCSAQRSLREHLLCSFWAENISSYSTDRSAVCPLWWVILKSSCTIYTWSVGTQEICCPKCHFSSVQNHQFRPKFHPNF